MFGGAYSEDLVHWEQTGPVFRSERDAYSIVEMPDLFELDGRWYLTFLEDNAYGNRDVLGEAERAAAPGTRWPTRSRVRTRSRPTTSCWRPGGSTGSAVGR